MSYHPLNLLAAYWQWCIFWKAVVPTNASSWAAASGRMVNSTSRFAPVKLRHKLGLDNLPDSVAKDAQRVGNKSYSEDINAKSSYPFPCFHP